MRVATKLAEGLLMVHKAYVLGYLTKEEAIAKGAEMEAAARKDLAR